MSVDEFTVHISNEGDVVYLHADHHPLNVLGKRQMIRASNVEWDKESQRWFVRQRSGSLSANLGGSIIGDPAGYETRGAAIQAEIDILNQELMDKPQPIMQLIAMEQGG